MKYYINLDDYIKVSGIYRITNKINKKIYIGSSQDVVRRLRQHRSTLVRNIHKNPKLQAAWNKYKEDSFEFEFLFSSEIKDLLYWEQLTINHLNPEYNICLIAGNTQGRRVSKETKIKLRTINLGKKYSNITKSKVSASSQKMWAIRRIKNPESFIQLQKIASSARYKSVDCICLKTGLVIKTYPSLVSTLVDSYQPANISAVCKGLRSQAHGFGWAWSA